MSDTRQDGGAVPLPRLFSVLGGAVTRSSLQQVQRDVDTIVAASDTSAAARPTSPGLGNASAAAASVQSLRRALEALRAAQTAAENSSTSERPTANDAAAPLTSPATTTSAAASSIHVRDALIQAFGVSSGSALYRECVVEPRRRIQRVVRQLTTTVHTCFLPFLVKSSDARNYDLRDCLLAPSEPVDVHVQLYPSSTDVSLSVVPATLRERGGFCAAVTVRRLAALEAEAAAGQRLQARYMDVAAAGQTLASALTFWSDVSYGDAPPAALTDFPPLGFDPDVSRDHHRAKEENRRLGEKALRSSPALPTAASEDESAGPSLLLGLSSQSQKPSSPRTGQQPSWTQPDYLVRTAAEESTVARRGGKSLSAPLPHVTYPSVGVVVVLYVHTSGVAYAAFPSSASPTEGKSAASTTAAPPAFTASRNENARPPAERVEGPRVCALPLLSSTGFTRSLLGLS